MTLPSTEGYLCSDEITFVTLGVGVGDDDAVSLHVVLEVCPRGRETVELKWPAVALERAPTADEVGIDVSEIFPDVLVAPARHFSISQKQQRCVRKIERVCDSSTTFRR